MDFLFEILIFIASGYYSAVSIYRWYNRIVCARHFEKSHTIEFTLGFLPVISFSIILYTLVELASFDVVGDSTYTIFYILLGFAWIFIGINLVFYFFDLSWIDDALQNRNKAALVAITGAFLGLTVIYAGANVGDGPGWWCVLFAGGLGVISWFLLSLLMNKLTQVFERITVGRDMYCGIRFGSYLLASGLILGRASAGDWTSFSMTIVEFLVGWPVLPVTLLAVLVERHYKSNARRQVRVDNNYSLISMCWGIIYILIAVLSIVMYPLIENPAYGGISARLSGVRL
jgi:hypothetical protein